MKDNKEIERLKEELERPSSNEEIFRECMQGVTRELGLNEATLWEEVEEYARALKEFFDLTNKLDNVKQEINRLSERNKIDYGIGEENGK